MVVVVVVHLVLVHDSCVVVAADDVVGSDKNPYDNPPPSATKPLSK